MDPVRIKEMAPDERPREKLLERGSAALSDAELLAILLRTGTRGVNAIAMARNLLARFSSLTELARHPAREIVKEHGIGLAKAIQLEAAFSLGHRLAQRRLASAKIDSPELVYELLGLEMQSLAKESLRALLLNTRYNLIKTEEISLGSLNESVAHPREILRAAITHSAFAFILVHNHPSGDPTPSEADIRLTRRINDAAGIVQINLLDHIIIGSPGDDRIPYYSFKEAGLL